MKFICLLLSLFFAGVNLSIASPIDTIKQKELNYNSELEKSIFERFQKHNYFDTLAFLLATDKAMKIKEVEEIRTNLQKFYTFLDNDWGNKKKPNKKFIDFLFKKVHNQFLKQYESNVQFHRLFKDGIYNCVTATALYALVLEHYNIDYQIKESPSHVYLVADPKSEAILIETTNPKGGFFAPTEKFKRNFVNELVESKIISQSQVNTEGVQTIFEKNFYEEGNIKIHELIALSYYNKAIDLSENEQNKEAFYEVEKANSLYPSPRMKYMLSVLFIAEMGKESVDEMDIETVKFYLRYLQYPSFNTIKKHIQSDFVSFSDKILMKKDKVTYYDEVYHLYKNAITDSSLAKNIDMVYYDYKAQSAFYKEKYSDALIYIDNFLQLDTTHVQMKYNMATCIVNKNQHRNDYKEVLKEMDTFALKYPFLEENSTFRRAKAYYLLILGGSACEDDRYSDGEIYLRQFENLMTKGGVQINEELIGVAYGEASSVCIRKLNDFKKGREWLNKGLIYAPNSSTLKRKLKVLDENPIPSSDHIDPPVDIKSLDIKQIKVSPPPKPKKSKN